MMTDHCSKYCSMLCLRKQIEPDKKTGICVTSRDPVNVMIQHDYDRGQRKHKRVNKTSTESSHVDTAVGPEPSLAG